MLPRCDGNMSLTLDLINIHVQSIYEVTVATQQSHVSTTLFGTDLRNYIKL